MVWAVVALISRLPLELVHCRRFRVAIWWLQALFSEVLDPLVRVFPVAASWLPRPATLSQMRALGVLPVSCSKVSSLWRGGHHQFVQAQHYLGSSRPRRAVSVCQVRGYWRALGLTHCQRSGAWYGSPASPPTSTLLPGSWPWTLSWACTQWASRLTSQAVPTDYLTICHERGLLSRTFNRSPLQQAPDRDRWFWKTTVTKYRSGTLARKLTPSGNQGRASFTRRLLGRGLAPSLFHQGHRSPHPTHCMLNKHIMVHSLCGLLELHPECFASQTAASRPCP